MSSEMSRADALDVLEDLRRQVGALADRVESLEAENAELRRELTETKEHTAKERMKIRRDHNDDVDELREELREEKEQRGREDGRIIRRLTAVEDEQGIDADDAIRAATEGHEGQALTTVGRLVKYGPEIALENATAKHYRARLIAEKFNDESWGERQMLGDRRVFRLASKKHDLKQRVEETRGEDVQWNQIYRAMEWIADNSEGTVRLVDGGEDDGKYVLEHELRRTGGDT
jgi:chromosome segregation ATPase